ASGREPYNGLAPRFIDLAGASWEHYQRNLRSFCRTPSRHGGGGYEGPRRSRRKEPQQSINAARGGGGRLDFVSVRYRCGVAGGLVPALDITKGADESLNSATGWAICGAGVEPLNRGRNHYASHGIFESR